MTSRATRGMLVAALAATVASAGCGGVHTTETDADAAAGKMPPSGSAMTTVTRWAKPRIAAIEAGAAKIAAGKLQPDAAVAECARLAEENRLVGEAFARAQAPSGGFDTRTSVVRALADRGLELDAAGRYLIREASVTGARSALSEKKRLAEALAREAEQNPGVKRLADGAAREVRALEATVAEGAAERATLLAAYRAARAKAEEAATALRSLSGR